jgi:hypothetical protein
MLSAGEKAGVPFLALQKIANHAVRREVTDRYLVLDVEFIRPHMETINARLLEVMQTSVEAWRQADRNGMTAEAELPAGPGESPEPEAEQRSRQIAWVLIDEEGLPGLRRF